MRIYVDFDDCLCETARYFSALAEKMFGVCVPYGNIEYFDLQRSFSLEREQYEQMMIEGHRPGALLSYEETPGAVGTVNGWLESGHDVSVITGRPYSAFEPSRAWLDRHGLEHVRLYCLNKYRRENFIAKNDFNLELEDFRKMRFDCIIEDSPSAFRFFSHLPEAKVLVLDRPWNRKCEFPGKNYSRCPDWETIRKLAAGPGLDPGKQ